MNKYEAFKLVRAYYKARGLDTSLLNDSYGAGTPILENPTPMEVPAVYKMLSFGVGSFCHEKVYSSLLDNPAAPETHSKFEKLMEIPKGRRSY